MAADFESELPTRAFHALNRLYARGLHHVSVEGKNHIPHTGPAIIVANHRSGVDPLLIQSLSPRPIAWMMAREYLAISAFNSIFRAMRVIPVTRDGKDAGALRSALRMLAGGALLGIFPEGRIAPTPAMLPFQTGAALIAVRSGAPVIPIYHKGIEHSESMIWPFAIPQTVRVYMGATLLLQPDPGDPRKFDLPSRHLESAVAALAAENYTTKSAKS